MVLDLWGSATMRTGGDDLAQALALVGCRPTWALSSNRVIGFEIVPLAALGRPRVDVTLRISGLFRDVFPSQIALFGAAVRAIAALDESEEDNPLAGLKDASVTRVFGAAPGAYGVGLGRRISEGQWAGRGELAEAYFSATSHAYDGEGDGREAAAAFRARVASAELFVHAQDLPGQDALDADAVSEHEGGFAAAAAHVGGRPALYHLDSSAPGTAKIRPLAQEIARALRGRAANPRWLAGQMRHGHRGAAEIAQSLDNLYAFAALTDAVRSEQFDLLFDATLGDDSVRAFLVRANRLAARHMARVFEEAARRGFWRSRRNSSASVLATLTKEAA
jgi:cobaltochelatase CobN